MSTNVNMNASFLANSRSTSYSSDKRKQYITWDCYPGDVYYNYVIPGGSTQRKGLWAADGIHRWNGSKYVKASTRCCYEANGSGNNFGEGVKCVKIQYRVNWGSWVTYKENWNGIPWADRQLKFTSAKNGECYEVKCTYQVWSQGSPFRDVPFMWFGDKSGYYNSGYNRFNTGGPADPQRAWSGLCDYTKNGNKGTDKNSDWWLASITWARPNSTDIWTNWTRCHANYWDNNGGSNKWKYSAEFYEKGMNNGTNMGWTGNVTGRNPQTCRKNLWWCFQRTFSDSYYSTGIKEKPDPLSNPTISVKAFNNLLNVDENNRYNGTKGQIQVTMNHAQGHSATYNVWAYTTDKSGKEYYIKVISNATINSGKTKTHTIDFTSSSFNFTRSRSIGYIAECNVWDGEYNTNRYAKSNEWGLSNALKNGSHYFNECPYACPSFYTNTVGDRTKNIKLQWDAAKDPDGHAITYYIYVCRDASKYSTSTSEKLWIDKEGKYVTFKYHNVYTTTALTYNLDTTKYNEGENLTIYICPWDGYWNNYYYGTKMTTSVDLDLSVSLKVTNNMTTKDADGILSGDHGTLSFTYSNKHNRKGRVRIYSYRSGSQANESHGVYIKRVYDSGEDVSTYISPGTYTLKIDFNKLGISRGHYIRYYAVAQDSEGIATKKPYPVDNPNIWSYATKGHYFNMVPNAVKPFVSEKYETEEDIFYDDILEIGWPASKDLEGHDINYKLYMQVVGDANNKKEKCYTSLSDAGTEREYTKIFNLGTNVSADGDFPYELDLDPKQYIGKTLNFWIKTTDKYNASKYLSSGILKLNNPGVKPEVPEIDVEYVYGEDFYGRDTINGEEGYITVDHSHDKGRAATVRLYAMLKRITDGKIRVIKDPITSWKLSSGSWSPRTKLNFQKLFGDEWRSSEIRYYATATTDLGECSVDKNWAPDANMWEDWIPGHKFNEEPWTPTIVFNDADSNLHYNAIIEWDPVNDPDDVLYPVMYSVVLHVKSDPRREMTFFHGSNKIYDEIKTFTQMWDTTNTRIELDLDGFDEGEEFELWIVPHDDYINSYYYTSNTITFKKATFGKPILTTKLKQTESERGQVIIKYEHEDVELINGKYVSKDPDKAVEDFKGLVYLYTYIDDRYSANFAIEGEEFKIGEEKTFTIEFDDVSPISRSVEIRYLAIGEDAESEKRNYDGSPSKTEPKDFVEGFHYYNDEPRNPEIFIGDLKDYVEEDVYKVEKFVYTFDYIFLCWDQPDEYDNDECVYYVYIKTPESFNEKLLNTTVNKLNESNIIEPVFIEYNRKYKIVEKYDKNHVLYGSDVFYCTNITNDTYEKIQSDNNFLGFRIDYKKDHLGKEWPEKELFYTYVEARDTRPLTNSYYGFSNEFECFRKRHEPPNDVQLKVIPNLSDGIGNGEEGKIEVTYTHPEGDINGTVDIYAYQNDENNNYILRGKICTIDTMCNGISQVITMDFLNNENSNHNAPAYRLLDRSKDVTYYAIATDHLVGMTSFDKYTEIGLDIKYVPYLIPDEEGKYNYYALNINGILHDFNVNGHYEGPVQAGAHYFNEEPPKADPQDMNGENITFDVCNINWNHVKDPDGDAVKYEVYVASSDTSMNTNYAYFYNDSAEALIPEEPEKQEKHDESMDVEPVFQSEIVPAVGELAYHKKIDIPFSVSQSAAAGLAIATTEYQEDATISIWLVSKDSYTNSYYRAGNMLTVLKGHKARDPRSIYPRNGSTVFAKTPRILINLAEDNQRQTVYVQWKDHTYNSKDNPEMFSSPAGVKDAVTFRPPEPYTTLHGMKVTYSVWVHNQCSFSNKLYSTYTYNNFFESFTEDQLIALKSAHINLFRRAVNITRDAYGLETFNFTRDIQKNMIFENFDFNETKKAICDVNDLLNNADDSEGLDYNNNLIVDVQDLDLVEYEHDIVTGSYNEFIEWARLVYILENL